MRVGVGKAADVNAEERAAQILAGATLGGLDPTDLRRRIAEGVREAVAAEREACLLITEQEKEGATPYCTGRETAWAIAMGIRARGEPT